MVRAAASLVSLLLLLAACAVAPAPPPPAPFPGAPGRPSPDVAARNFIAVVNHVEPVAERECRQRAPHLNCDFLIVVDDRRGLPPNAFQTVDSTGRPVIGFTLALIADARNRDELAFILGHEAAHHILEHLPITQQTAATGALVAGILAQLGGADARGVRVAQDIGGTLAARQYSKLFELEADQLGAIIALRAGYDPLRGVEFFMRVPDPGDRFLGTHPPNAERIITVRRTVAGL